MPTREIYFYDPFTIQTNMLAVVLAHLLPEPPIETTTPLKGLIEDPTDKLVVLVNLYPCGGLLVFSLLTHNLRLLEVGDINMGFMQEVVDSIK